MWSHIWILVYIKFTHPTTLTPKLGLGSHSTGKMGRHFPVRSWSLLFIIISDIKINCILFGKMDIKF